MEQPTTPKMEWKQQMQAYVAWVNSQLKKRSGTKPVTDLGNDLCDGKVLAQLLEIISNETVQNINLHPNNEAERLLNIICIINFMKKHNIQMHRINEQDIVDGNLKSMMRLILALAAHFKPLSVGASKAVNAVAVNAAVAMGDLRKQVTASGGSRHRWRSGSPSVSSHRSRYTNSQNSAKFQVRRYETDHRFDMHASPRVSPKFRTTTTAENGTSTTPYSSPCHTKLIFSPADEKDGASMASEFDDSYDEDISFASNTDQLIEEQENLGEELDSTRSLIVSLQNLLLNGVVPEQYQSENADKDKSCDAAEGGNLQEQIVVLNSRIDQLGIENDQLKKTSAKLKEELREASAGKSALHSRLQKNEVEMLDTKQQLLRMQLDHEQIRNQNIDLTSQLEENKQLKEHLLNKLDLKERKIEDLQKKLLKSSTQMNRDDYKLLNMKDEQIKQLENQVQEISFKLHSNQNHQIPHSIATEEGQIISESLHTLRKSLPSKDAKQHVLDTLEQAVLSVMQSLHGSPYISHNTNRSRNNNTPLSIRPHENNTPLNHRSNDNRHSTSSNHKRYSLRNHEERRSTVIIYFTDKTMTPNRINVNKRIGEITLGDFKSHLNLRGNPHFHFKAQDPEYGTVKQEVFNDNDILPGWEGKIVSWIDP